MRKRNNRLDSINVKPSRFKGATARVCNKEIKEARPSLRRLRI
jgi:hypothetical protein